MFGLDDDDLKGIDSMGTEELGDALWAKVRASYDDKRIVRATSSPASSATSCCRSSTAQWKDHLYSLDHLKEGIGLRGYGQRDPLVEYKRELALFQAMLRRVEEEIVRYVWWLKPVVERDGGEAKVAAPARPAARKPAALSYNNPSEQATRRRSAAAPRHRGSGGWQRPDAGSRTRAARVAATTSSRR